MQILSPAKINLMLRILGRRKDGYHLLQTYFQLLDWGDYMSFKVIESENIKIFGDFNNLPTQQNLIYKAAKLLSPYKNKDMGIEIHVEKNIPEGSGLGGGSSNAGTTLRELNKLWDCNLSQQKLLELGIKLGADVPIFILNKSAMATGVGNLMTPLMIQDYFFVLIFPKTSITTANVFSDNHLVRNQERIEDSKIKNKANWTNTCLEVVLYNYPEVNEIYIHASKLATIYMSGTGSTLFACFNNHSKAKKFIHQCPKGWNTTICRSKNV